MSNPFEDHTHENSLNLSTLFRTTSMLPFIDILDSRQPSGMSGELIDTFLTKDDVDQTMKWALQGSKSSVSLPPLPQTNSNNNNNAIATTTTNNNNNNNTPFREGDISPTKRIKIDPNSLSKLMITSSPSSPTKQQQQQQQQQEDPQKEKDDSNKQSEEEKVHQTPPPPPPESSSLVLQPLVALDPRERSRPPIVNVQLQLQVDGKTQLAEMQCEQVIKKLLTATDTGRLGRIILPRYQVENHLPVANCLADRDTGMVVHAMELRDWQKTHTLKLKFWVNGGQPSSPGSASASASGFASNGSSSTRSKNNNKRMWLFEGTKDLVAGKKPGDTFCLYKSVDSDHYFVDCC